MRQASTRPSVRPRESQRVEWKESWRDDCLKWISGFANGEGGTLVIGRNDAGDVVRLKDAQRLLEEIPNKVRDILGIIVDVGLRKQRNLEYLEIATPAYANPISYRGEFYYRSGSTNQALKGPSLERFLLRKQGRTWDGVPAPYVALRDLSRPAIATFRKLAKQGRRHDSTLEREPIPSLIDKLGLLEGKHLKRAAVLLFHPEPDHFITGAFVKIGYFRTEADLLYQDEIKGDLFTQAQKTIDLVLTKYLKAAISYEGIQRVESFPMPEEALREAVLNALIHRDYAVGSPIQIRVYADRLSIWNPGELPEGWSVASLLQPHASRPYNPLLARAFFRAGAVEAWGRGVQGIFEGCETAGTPRPRIRCEARDIWVEFPFAGRTTPIATLETTPIPTPERIVALLRAHPTMTSLQTAHEVSLTLDGVKYHLRRLRAAGILQHVGPSRAGRWEVLK
ncbi:MAG: ATP-binding protein [Vicinamibacteria bacterium]